MNDKKCKTTTKLSDLGDECDTSEESSKIIMLGRTGMIVGWAIEMLSNASPRIHDSNSKLVDRGTFMDHQV